jgi:hypothetical protein
MVKFRKIPQAQGWPGVWCREELYRGWSLVPGINLPITPPVLGFWSPTRATGAARLFLLVSNLTASQFQKIQIQVWAGLAPPTGSSALPGLPGLHSACC